MTIHEFARNVEAMRLVQQQFFKGDKSPQVINEAKRREKQIDRIVAEILEPTTLFDSLNDPDTHGGQ